MESSYDIIKLKVRFLSMINYSYIIIDKYSNQAAIVDPSWESKKIIDKLENLDVELKFILLTHSHFDHTFSVPSLVKRYSPKVFMSRQEIEFYKYSCKNLYMTEDLDLLNLGKTKIRSILTPGHTAGGMCFLLSDSLFTGDTIFSEGCGMCNGQGGCPDKMFDSIQRIRDNVSANTQVYPGHSYGIEPGYSLEELKAFNIYFNLNRREDFISFRMRKNQTNLLDFK